MVNNIINTKVKFARNLKGVTFNTNTNTKSLNEVLKLSIDTCNKCGLKAEALSKINEDVLNNLITTNMLERDFVVDKKYKGFAVLNDTTVQINGNNHIEVFSCDEDVLKAYNNAKTVDKILCSKLNFLYSDKYGFLSSELDKIGCGMQTEICVILPALHQSNSVKSLPQYCDKLGFKIYSINNQNAMYLIRSSASLGYSEKQICDMTLQYLDNVIKCEKNACKIIAKDKVEVLDKSLRAKAIINSCLKITSNELFKLIGDILIAINSGIEDNKTNQQINKLFNAIKNQDLNNQENLAKLIKNILIN